MTDRRSFLKRLAGTGALLATSQLPSFAEDKPEIFPERGRFERLSMSYATVEIGLERPFSLLHISDSHLTDAYPHEGERQLNEKARRTRTFGGRQEEALRDALAWAKEHVEYVLHTGDIIDWQSEANFDLVAKYFGEGFIGNIGNHEYKDLTRDYKEDEAYKDPTRKLLQEHFPGDILFTSQVLHGVNFITLDDVYGTVTKEQVRRFKKEVRKGLPIVLCMHVPFYTDKIYRENCRFWRTREPMTSGEVPEYTGDCLVQKTDKVTRDFIAYLKKEPLLKCILAGHLHITTEDQFSPTCREYVVGGGFLFTGREVLFI
ncbi:MAG: metallophosphoesterase [Bacteroidales bacterium]|nr:metallophosphoesterase [Bacteroidales bacterium]